MTIRNLDKMFSPRSVALIGASARRESVGHVLLKNFLALGFSGPFAAVNPRSEEINGFRTVPDIASLPFVPDMAIIATPPSSIPGIIRELAKKGSKAALVISAGFGELGAAGKKLEREMLEAAQPSLMRIVGPNCLGIIIPSIRLNASFSHINALPGDIALVSQSGAIITTILDWAAPRNIGFSHIVSLGGKADVDFGDMLDYLTHDVNTRSILLYIEAIEHARKFMSAARRAARLKPVIVIKAGRHAEAAKAAASHTGALAGSDAVYQAAFERAGMLRVSGIEDLFSAAQTLSAGITRKLQGDRLAILTNGGGFGVLATDTLLDKGGHLAPLSDQTLAALNAVLPPTWSHANPIDIIGDADATRYQNALEVVLRDPDMDAALVLNCPTALVDGVEAAQSVANLALKSSKPVYTAWLGGSSAAKARRVFYENKIPTFETQDLAITSFVMQAQYLQNQRLLLETPPPSTPLAAHDTRAVEALVAQAMASGREWLNEEEAKSVLAAYGIPVVQTRIAKGVDEAAVLAEEAGFPCAIKILSPDIQHKTDVGGVALNLEDIAAVKKAASQMLQRIKDAAPQARIEGFTVQRMANRPGAIELIAGIANDRTFGPVILFGQGGVTVEIVKDRAVALPPLNQKLANDLIKRTRVSRLLESYRGRKAADIASIEQVIMTLGELAADIPQILELDINPLWADADGILALDARIRLQEPKLAGTRRFAIRPYPERLQGSLKDKDGKSYPMRPIKPDDAILIDQLLARTDPEDVRMRFLSALRTMPQYLAARLTQIDYDREMAFIIFTNPHQTDVAAVGRLSEDPDRERAEYAILVRTDHKGRGLGYALMHHLIGYARERGIGEIFGHVLHENHAMLAMCDDLGFQRHHLENEPGVVEVSLQLRDA